DTPDYFGATRVTQAAAAALPEPGASESLRPVDEDREAEKAKEKEKEKTEAKGDGAQAGGGAAVAGERSGTE
ncbi:peptidase P60, partial [Streptomyces sp. SID11233]|nr:peptidase P60 [Streptomyces sp. SID11233]